MYQIKKKSDHLLVEFLDDFNFHMIQTIIRHVTLLKEYPDTNDIWLIGNYRADIRLGELEAMVREFQCGCPETATRSQTAVVVDEGLTHAIFELWIKGLRKRVAFDIQIFHSLADAEAWLGLEKSMVA